MVIVKHNSGLVSSYPDKDTVRKLVEALQAYIDEWHADDANFERVEPRSLALARAALAQARGE